MSSRELAGSATIDRFGDEQLVAMVAVRDEAAFEELYRRHRSGLLTFGHRLLGDWQAAEEVVQDAFLTFWRRAGDFEGRSTIRTWLYAVTRNNAMNRLRKAKIVSTDLAELAQLDDLEAPEDGPEDQAIATADKQRLALLIDTLRPVHREVLTLAFTVGMSCAEIGQVLGVPAGTVRSRLSRAKQQLGARLTTDSIEVAE